jgi:hypothetical protein
MDGHFNSAVAASQYACLALSQAIDKSTQIIIQALINIVYFKQPTGLFAENLRQKTPQF